jgi:TRAP-type C4-dicarboxylate transport system permease small subunit
MLVERVCALLMIALVVDVFLGVFSRYVLQATFKWYDEVARLCFVWIIFLGAAVAVRRRLHFRVHLLIDRLRPVARAHAGRFVTLTVIGFGAILVAGGIRMAPIAMRQVTDALEISQLWFFGALPVGGALMILFALPQWRDEDRE